MDKYRFRPVDNGFSTYIEDTALTEDKHEGYLNNVFECCELLNHYYEENEKLKKDYEVAIDEMITDYKKLEEENKQLLNEISYWKHKLSSLLWILPDYISSKKWKGLLEEIKEDGYELKKEI